MANLIFGGKKIGSDKLQFDVDRGILPEVANTSVQIGKSNGAKLQYGRYNPRVLAANFDCSALSQREFERELAPLLASDDVQDLIIDDRPDEVWHAKVDGTINLTRAYFLGNGVINFVCFDPYAHAIDTKSFTSTDGSPIAVTYNGTAPSSPVLTQTMTGDNGLVGWVNSNGAVLQFGDPESVDGEELSKSDRILRWNMTAAPTGATINTGCVSPYMRKYGATADNAFAGSVLFGRDVNKKQTAGGEFAYPQFTSVADNVWHGPGIHGAIKANSAGSAAGDFGFATRIGFSSSNKTVSRMEFTLESAGAPAATIVIRDSSLTGNTKVFESWVGTKLVKSINLDPKRFTNGGFELVIQRQGDTTTFKCSKIVKITDIKATSSYSTTSDIGSIDGVTTWAEQAGKNPVANIYWTDLKFDWVNVAYWNDIPNQFEAGDVITVDVANRSVLVNDVPSGLFTIGNEWDKFSITEDCTIQPIVSSWAQPPKATIQVREAYL